MFRCRGGCVVDGIQMYKHVATDL
uniref:Uncharacterized protein n=1 Tax=Arundo donax TaxID=35708 RepID=A0A0A8YBG3_ARUDO